jgi:hypothetical protein
MYDEAIGRAVAIRVHRGSETLELAVTPVELPD